MARPSKLTPAQWAEVERRAAEGESHSALAREFKLGVSTVSARVSRVSETVREAAHKLADAQTALEALPVKQQIQAVGLADRLRNMSNSLASAAELGADTSHRLNALANKEALKLEHPDQAVSLEAVRKVGVLGKLATESASIALNLLSANKERVRELDGFADKVETPAPVRERLSLAEWKKHHGIT